MSCLFDVDYLIRYKISTSFKLGVHNIFSVVLYRFLKKAGYYRIRFPVKQPIKGPFFTSTPNGQGGSVDINFFSFHKFTFDSPPDWFLNPWTGSRFSLTDKHWSEISDFIPELGDIKTVWELSRFDWLPQLAWSFKNGDKNILTTIELWLRDWCYHNPPNSGINWKCGQETGLRAINMLVASMAIEDRFDNPFQGFLDFLYRHAERIEPTLSYAIAQNNNHGISEASALFAVGNYLAKFGTNRYKKNGRRWAKIGRCWLENRIKKLIFDDGSFAQHSLIYHRMILDELSLLELLRRRLKSQPFSYRFYDRVKLTVKWLHNLVDTISGDAPNLGANDGSYLFNMNCQPYRNFIPSLELGSAVFLKKTLCNSKQRHPCLELFEVDTSNMSILSTPSSRLLPNGGYACIRHEYGFSMLRLPVYKFRPSHADALHLDLWHNGVNWVRDSGTYSYNTQDTLLSYFPGTSAHSTVCCDKRDQMPRLSRFLFGAWLKPGPINWSKTKIVTSYKDYKGARHKRSVAWGKNKWIIEDEISGFEKEAIIRWHLSKEEWHLEENILQCNKVKVKVHSIHNIKLKLTCMPESRYYLDIQQNPVLEIKCYKPACVKTEFIFTT